MEQFYLYGAGINGIGAIEYFGKENIKAIIDGDKKKHGTKLHGIDIISLDEYIKRNDKKFILISTNDYAEEIAEILKKHSINNFAKCPFMQVYFSNCAELIEKLELYKYKSIALYKRTPFSEQLKEYLNEYSVDMKFVFICKDEMAQISEETPIIITSSEDKEEIDKLQKKYLKNLILEISDIYKKNYKFVNENLLKFKNIYKGKRCFLIGNGPSLSYQDLDKLHENGEICFGVNRIYYAFEHTKWRPTYYVAVDNIIIERDREIINELPGVKFIRHINNMPKWSKENDIYEFGNLGLVTEDKGFSFDIENGVYSGGTVIYEALQIAFYMGFNEIYLIGVDQTKNIRYEDEGSHFYKTPNKKENLGYGNRIFVLKSFKYAGEIIEEQGRIIRNASRLGEWDELKRIQFDSLFK